MEKDFATPSDENASVRLVLVDGEMLQLGIYFAGGEVVIAVPR